MDPRTSAARAMATEDTSALAPHLVHAALISPSPPHPPLPPESTILPVGLLADWPAGESAAGDCAAAVLVPVRSFGLDLSVESALWCWPRHVAPDRSPGAR